MEIDSNEASSMSADYKNWSDRGSCPNQAAVDCALNLVLTLYLCLFLAVLVLGAAILATDRAHVSF